MKHIKHYLFFSISALLFFLGSYSFSFAQNSSQNSPAKPVQVVIKDAQIGNGGITGTIAITNPNTTGYEKASYTVRLLTPDKVETKPVNGENVTVLSPGELIDFKNSPYFGLSSQQSLQFPIGLRYSANLKPGSYKIQVAVSDINNKLLGSDKESITLTGNSTFLSVDNCVIVAGGVEYPPGMGPNISPKGEVYGECTVRNPTNRNISVKNVTVYAINQVVGSPELEKKTITTTITNALIPGENKKIRFPLPSLDVPQVYEAISYLVDAGSTQISPQVAFRWVVTGESSLIRSVSLNLGQFEKGQEAKVTVAADPSMDLFWRGGGPAIMTLPMASSFGSIIQPQSQQQGTPLLDPKILVTITDSKGATCGQAEQKVTQSDNQRSWANQVISVPIQQSCDHSTAKVTIKNGDKELAQKTSDVVTSPFSENGSGQTNQALSKAEQMKKYFLNGLIGVIVLLAIGGVILYWRKKRNKSTPPPVAPPIAIGLVFFLFVTIGASQAMAAPLEVKPGQQPVSVSSSSINISNLACNVAPFQSWIKTPDANPGYCTFSTNFVDSVNFDFLDTQDEFSFTDDAIHARVAGRLSGVGCANTQAGLIIRAFVDGTNEGVKINGGPSKLVVGELVRFTSGTGSKDVDLDLSITPGGAPVCGPHNVKLELIPFVMHADLLASDPAEDPVFPKDYPNQNAYGVTVSYGDRKNCGGTEPCWGVLEKEVTKPCSCNEACTTPADCQGDKNGCTACLPSNAGSGNVCQPPPPACGVGCTDDKSCAANREGCTACIPGANGSGSVCAPPPACNTSCTDDKQCTTAKDGCVQCAPNSAGKNVCQPPFNDAMCKCDGFNALNLKSPSEGKFQFEAFGKVEGDDVSRAKITNMKFTLYKSAKSDPNHATAIASGTIVPQIVSSANGKERYRAVWDVTPPAYEAGAIYRVGAEPSCVRKTASASASLNFSPNTIVLNSDNSEVLGATQDYTPVKLTQDGGLELDALKDAYFTRVVETDSCRFIKFEYGQY